MTPQKFLLNFFEIEPVRYDQEGDVCLCEMIEAEVSNENLEELVEIMKNYAKLMCEKQKEICAEEAETKDISSALSYETYYVIDKDSILNSPFPEELL